MIYGEEFTLHCDTSMFKEGEFAQTLDKYPCKITKIEEGKLHAKPLTWFGNIFYDWGWL